MILAKSSISSILTINSNREVVVSRYTRIAIHLTGQIRDSMTVIQEKLINPLIRMYDTVDLFVFVDNPESVMELTGINIAHIVDPDKYQDIHRMKLNSNKMFYRMKVLQEEFESYSSQYDVVIRARPDIVLRDKFILKESMCRDTIVVTPRLTLPLSPTPKSMTDIIFYGPVSLMRVVNKIYDSYILTKCLNPEIYLHNFLSQNNIPFSYDTSLVATLKLTDISNFKINLSKQLTTLSYILSSDDC